MQVWSWGINDNGVLGRVTENVEGQDSDELESQPMLVEGLEDFKAVRIAAGDGVSMAISDKGEVRSWGCFRVRLLLYRCIHQADAKGRIKMA